MSNSTTKETATQIWWLMNQGEITSPTEKELEAAKKYVEDANEEVRASITELEKLRRRTSVSDA